MLEDRGEEIPSAAVAKSIAPENNDLIMKEFKEKMVSEGERITTIKKEYVDSQ